MSSGGRSAARAGRSRSEKNNKTKSADPAGDSEEQRGHILTPLRPEDKVYEEKISQVVQLTGKTKDEAEIALYDCDYDPTRAINMLLEGEGEGEWVEKTKKKKVTRPAADAAPAEGGERLWPRDGQPPRLRRAAAQDSSWRAREMRENEKNAADTGGGGEQRRWGTRGGSRGGRGGRRSFQPRRTSDRWVSSSWSSRSGGFGPQLSGAGDAATSDDWDSEDWDEPLTDTKVFVPSSTAQPGGASILAEDAALGPASPPPASSLSASIDLTALLGKPAASDASSRQSTSVSTTTNGTATFSQLVEAVTSSAALEPATALNYNSAAVRTGQQTQPGQPTAPCPSGYTEPPGLYSSSAYTSENITSQLQFTLANSSQQSHAPPPAPARTKTHRSRVLANPKIPESAVEMPDETVSSLGVKFGRLDFGTADTIISHSDGASDRYGRSSSPPKELTPPQVAENSVDSSAGQYSGVSVSKPSTTAPAPPAGFTSPPAGVDTSAPSGFALAAAGGGATFTQLAASYQAAQSHQQANYGDTPTEAGSDFRSSGSGSGYSPAMEVPAASSGTTSYSSSRPTSSAPSFSSSQSVSTAVSSASSFSGASSVTYSGPAGFGDTSYHNGAVFSGSSAPSGSSGGLAGTSLQEKLTSALSGAVQQAQHEPASSASQLPLPTSLVGPAAGSGPAARTTAARAGAVPAVPPGVPMQYFVGQTPGVPFYPGVQQMYSYEDVQALQRLPHMPPQPGCSQARGDAGSALAAAFSMADAKFSRQEVSSPVQTSQIGQQLKSHQQQQQQYFSPATGIPPNYTYFPFVPQYSIYTSLPPSTNTAHQAAAPSGGQYPKLAAYNAAAGGGPALSSYDPLGSSSLPTADFKSGGAAYVGSASAGLKLGGSAPGAGAADLYGKMAALGGKFDNKGFHAATPPPYGVAGGAGSTPLAAAGGYPPHMFIQPMPTQHALVHPGHGEPAPAAVQQRPAAPAKSAAKPTYSAGYWPAN